MFGDPLGFRDPVLARVSRGLLHQDLGGLSATLEQQLTEPRAALMKGLPALVMATGTAGTGLRATGAGRVTALLSRIPLLPGLDDGLHCIQAAGIGIVPQT